MKAMRNLLSAVMLLLALSANAQVNPVEGFIITNQNDTIRGMIDLRTNQINASQCLFKADDATEYVTYKPGEIAGYRFKKSGKYYVSRKFENEGCFFAEFLVQGSLNLYRKEIGFRRIYYIEDKDGKVVTYEEMEKDDNYNEREEKVRAQRLYTLVALSPNAVKDIKVGKMSDKQMIKMARDYNDDVCTSDEECILYEHDPKSDKVKFSPVIFAGGTYAMCANNDVWTSVRDAAGYTFGAGLDIDLSRVGKGMVFQMSAQYSRLYTTSKPKIVEHTDGSWFNAGVMYRLPITGKLKLAPRFGASFTIQSGMGHQQDQEYEYFLKRWFAPYVGCGIELPLGKHALNFSVEYRCLKWGQVNMIQGVLGFRI